MVIFDEENNYGPWRKYVKIRVEIEIEQPLKQDLILEGDVQKYMANIWLVFKYGKLGKFCFVCGSIGHREIFCNKKYLKDFSNGEKRWLP